MSVEPLVHVPLVREIDMRPVLLSPRGELVQVAGGRIEHRDGVGLVEEGGQPGQQRMKREGRRPLALQCIGTDHAGLTVDLGWDSKHAEEYLSAYHNNVFFVPRRATRRAVHAWTIGMKDRRDAANRHGAGWEVLRVLNVQL